MQLPTLSGVGDVIFLDRQDLREYAHVYGSASNAGIARLLRARRGAISSLRRAAVAPRSRRSLNGWSLHDDDALSHFFILFIPVLFLRTSAEEAAAVLTSIGMIVFGFNYPVGFGITMAVVFLIIAVWLGYDFARRSWRPK